MSEFFTCKRGHQWAPHLQDVASDESTERVCPLCGSPAGKVQEATEDVATVPPSQVPDVVPGLPAATLRVSRKDPPQTPLSVPLVEGYQILEELGRGGMGVVYKAVQLSLGRVVALKMVLAGAQAGPFQLTRFRAEARAAARLRHPNVVQIYEVGEQDGLPFFSQEFVEGGSLADQLDGTPLPAQSAAQMVETLARAVHHAHQHGIVHRDLKPGNVLLQPEEGRESGGGPSVLTFIPKIADFGTAKRLDETSESQTRTGEVIGTPQYMAPEQALGRTRGIGPHTDVYALGAILYALLTGRPPFAADTPFNTLLQVAYDDPVPPARLYPRVPLDLETICLKCLEKEPKKRYASAEALAEDLRRFLAGEPIEARPIGLSGRLWKWARRRPTAALLVAVSGLAALALFGLGLWFGLERDAAAKREGDLRAAAEARAAEANDERLKALKEKRAADDAKERASQEGQKAREKEADAHAQKIEADRQRKRALAKARQARDAVDQMLSRVAREYLALIPGMAEERKKLLEEALRFYAGLAKEEGDDPEVRLETARASRRVGEVYRFLGRQEEARKALAQSVILLEVVMAGSPEDRDARRELALGYFEQGRLLREEGRLKGAAAALRKALDQWERLRAADQDDPGYRQETARADSELALVLRNAGQPDQAEARYGTALGLQQPLVGAFPEEPDYRLDLASSFNDRGNLRRSRGRLAEAEADYREALPLFTWLVEFQRENPTYRQKLATALNNLGAIHLERGEVERGCDCLCRARDEWQRLYLGFPTVPTFRQELAKTWSNLAQVYGARRMPAESRAAHEQAKTLQEKLLEDFKDSESRPDYQSGLGAILDNYAHALLADPGEEKRVREFLTKALPCHQAAVKANPGNPAYRQFFCNHFVVEAERLLAGRKLEDAARVADGLPDVMTEAGLERSWPEHVTAARILAKCATAAETKGRPFADRAVKSLRAAIRLGYRNAVEMRKAGYFSALQSRDDFQELVADLEKREKMP